MAAHNPATRKTRVQIAAHTLWSGVQDRTARTAAAARAGFDANFERLVDPNSALDPVERARLAKNARKAQFLTMALESVPRQDRCGPQGCPYRRRRGLMPRNEEGRPRGDGPAFDVLTDSRVLGGRPTRAEVDQAHRDWWFQFGHSIGWRDGIEAGRNQVLTAIIDSQDDTRRRLGRLAREPVWAELERIRREPGGKLWSDNLAACGGREYLGGPVPVW